MTYHQGKVVSELFLAVMFI